MTQHVYVDHMQGPNDAAALAHSAAAADGRLGELLSQEAYAVPIPTASSTNPSTTNANAQPTTPAVLLSLYEEFGADADALAAAAATKPAADTPPALGSNTTLNKDENITVSDEPDSALDYEVLVAAQTLLAAMVRPGVRRGVHV